MPCDQILNFPVDLALCNKDMLADTLKDMKINARRIGDAFYFQWEGRDASIVDGELTVNGYSEAQTEEVARKIKSEFAHRTVRQATKRFGWTVQKTPVKNKIKLRHS